MRLSEAIVYGASLRPEHHQDGVGRFCYVEGRGLCSDVWGAAVEAVMPRVIEFNWGLNDSIKLQNSMDAFNAVQSHYFKSYLLMPARCPGARQYFSEGAGRIINSKGDTKVEGERVVDLGGITSECKLVSHMYGMTDHLFYQHNWSRIQVAEAVQWYEETRTFGLFRHFQNPTVAADIRKRLTEPLSAYPKLAKTINGGSL